ncbi:hypothetical protein [Rhizobium leguminosarum]|uniref:hypothetical protein n=1 Tax=Rhizobium leguminosarum TaxID=384 RepID=UPI0011AE3420|nr:hypothetical protein [Rhizobium leguminosarum]
MNINAYFDALLKRYAAVEDVASIIDESPPTAEGVDLMLDFSLYIAGAQGERAAIDFCEKLHHHLLDVEMEMHVGKVLVAQAKLFDKIGKGMSRDIYAVEAAEAFVMFGQYPAAEAALAMVQA